MPINKRSSVPAYVQLADILRENINSGELPDEYQLPSLPALIAEHDVSMSVVRQALQQLESEGLITTHQGRGSFVRRPRRHLREGMTRHLRSQRRAGLAALEAEAGKQNQQRVSRMRDVSHVPAPERVATLLGVEPGASVLRRRYVLDIGGSPSELAESFFTHNLADGTILVEPRNIHGGTHSYLVETLRLNIKHASELLIARMPTPQEIQDLSLSPGTPVVELTRTFYTQDETPVEVTVFVFAGDRHEFAYDVPVD
jgi:GntR family transcriptional regulator